MMDTSSQLRATFAQMLQEELPNFFRLFLNPYVAQTCLWLERAIQSNWKTTESFQSFLANSFDEALSGAIKLARYHASAAGRTTAGWIIDPDNKLGPFASTVSGSKNVEFVPGLVVRNDISAGPPKEFSFVVLVNPTGCPAAVRDRIKAAFSLVIICADRANLRHWPADLEPDLVVFDESFVNREVPFGAFTARKSIYDHWNRPGKSTFHSTTFQPNTVSALQFLNCQKQADPEFHAQLAPELARIDADFDFRKTVFQRLYSPSLAKAIRMSGCESAQVRAKRHYVDVDGQRVLDAVGGVACSVRGHNPPTYLTELDQLAKQDCEAELTARLHRLTGLDDMLPAVSGAGAIEVALKLALVSQFPRRHVIALKAGFGGKTLLALTGTWSPSYKESIAPLYDHVSFVDPFATDAITQIDELLTTHDVAVIQLELIQGVGGVRCVPDSVVRHLDASRARHGYLLLIDEVQTGVHRTGPFTLSRALDITPDLLVVGKAISDMMFPFALTLYTRAVRDRVNQVAPELLGALRQRYHYPFGFKTALNVLGVAERLRLSDKVAESGALFAKLLREELADCKAVRDVRVFGLLIGIELDASPWPQRWLRKRLFWFYLAAMLRHPRFPVLVGFCQAEPHVLKITPPLTIDTTEIEQTCTTIGEVLRRPFYRLLASSLRGLLGFLRPGRRRNDNLVIATNASVRR